MKQLTDRQMYKLLLNPYNVNYDEMFIVTKAKDFNPYKMSDDFAEVMAMMGNLDARSTITHETTH